MSRFPFHELTENEFEKLVVILCRETLGIGITSFAQGKDGGKDAKFEGTATAFPSKTAPASGKFLIQAKHTSFPASCSDSDFEKTLISKEIQKIKQQFDEGRLTHYIIFTNRRKTGGAEDRITDRIKNETGVKFVWLRGLEDIDREIILNPHIGKAVGLDKLRSPIQFTPDDIRDVIISFHNNRKSISEIFDSQHDFYNYPGLEQKNKINDLSSSYDKYIRDNSMIHFADIRKFLENGRNQMLSEQYHAVADELKGQIILHRDKFQSFDHVLENISNLLHERSLELQIASRRRLTKIFVHYMYVNCDIGDKA